MPTKPYTPPLPLFTDGAITPGCEWVLRGHGEAHNYLEGLPALVQNGDVYRVNGGNSWVKCFDTDGRIYREALQAYEYAQGERPENGLYQVIGRDVYNNPYGLPSNTLAQVLNDNLTTRIEDRSYSGMREYFRRSPVYAVLFTYTRNRAALVKRTEFGFSWPPFRVLTDAEIAQMNEEALRLYMETRDTPND